MTSLRYLILLSLFFITSCSTVDQFRSYVNNSSCRPHQYAALAFPLNANGTVIEGGAGVSCSSSLYSAKQIAKDYCERNYANGRSCVVSVTYDRSTGRFENVTQQNIAEARSEQANRYIDNLKDRCAQIGYQRETPQNADCVLKLSQQAALLQQQQNAINQQQQDRALIQMMQGIQMMNQAAPVPPTSINCQSYTLGHVVNTNCR